MYWDFFVFLICFILTAGLLGVVMYGLICVSDLENDYINPHDASVTLNTWAIPEFVVQALVTIILGLTGKWGCCLMQIPMLIYNGRLYLRGDYKIHATDAFQSISSEKKLRIGKLVFYIVFFVLIIYKTIHILVHGLMNDEQRDVAQDFFKDALLSY